jgi:hypothetical protein
MSRQVTHAFTLIEVVLAITLTLGLVGSALSFNHYVQSVKRDVLGDVEAAMAQQRAMELMTCELRSAFLPTLPQRDTSAAPVGLKGSAQQVDFLSTTLPGATAWLTPERHEAGMTPQGDVQWVTYRIRQGADKDGKATNAGLERLSLAVIPLGGEGVSSPTESDLVAPGVHFLHLRYHVGNGSSGGFSGTPENGWSDNWDGSLPLAVEITMGRRPLADGEDVQEYLAHNEVNTRVVYLPSTGIAPLGGQP